MLAAPHLAGTAWCFWSCRSQMKPRDAFISFWQDIIRYILMWVTIYDPFTSNLGIVDNWKPLDYPWIFIVPLPFFLYNESHLCNPKSSVFTYTYSLYIVIQQPRTAESEVPHTTLLNRPLTLLQKPITTAHHEHRVSLRLVYCIRRFIFIYYQQQTQFEPIWTSSVATHEGPNSILCSSPASIFNTPTILCHTVTTQMFELEAWRTTFGGVICRGDHDQLISQFPISGPES